MMFSSNSIIIWSRKEGNKSNPIKTIFALTQKESSIGHKFTIISLFVNSINKKLFDTEYNNLMFDIQTLNKNNVGLMKYYQYNLESLMSKFDIFRYLSQILYNLLFL